MPYKQCVIKTTVVNIKEDGEDRFMLLLPIYPSALTVVRLGELITYRLHLHEGAEVMALIGYHTPMPQELKDMNKQFGINWSDIKNDPDYAKHWPYTKETALGVWDRVNNIFIPYTGADKDDLVKFKHWSE